MMTSNSRLQGQGAIIVGKSTAIVRRQAAAGWRSRSTHAPALYVCDVDGRRLDAGGAVAKNLSNNGSIHGLPCGWVVKLERGGGDAVVARNIGPQIVRVEHAVHTAVFVGDGFGAIPAKE